MAGQNSRGGTGKPSKRFFRQALLSFIVFLHGNGFGLVLMYIIPPFRFFSNLSIWPRFASDLVCAQSLFRIIFISRSSRQAAVSPRFLLHNFADVNAYPLAFFSMQLLFSSPRSAAMQNILTGESVRRLGESVRRSGESVRRSGRALGDRGERKAIWGSVMRSGESVRRSGESVRLCRYLRPTVSS